MDSARTGLTFLLHNTPMIMQYQLMQDNFYVNPFATEGTLFCWTVANIMSEMPIK